MKLEYGVEVIYNPDIELYFCGDVQFPKWGSIPEVMFYSRREACETRDRIMSHTGTVARVNSLRLIDMDRYDPPVKVVKS